MTILKHRKRPDGTFLLRVHLDETKLVDGQPDRAWVRDYEWAPKPDGMTQTDWVTQHKQETKLLAQLALAEMQAAEGGNGAVGTAVPGSEGTTL